MERRVLVLHADFGDRHVVTGGQAVLQTFDDATFVFQAHRIANGQFQLQHTNMSLKWLTVGFICRDNR